MTRMLRSAGMLALSVVCFPPAMLCAWALEELAENSARRWGRQ